MATNTKNTASRQQAAGRRRRNGGISLGLVIVLLIISILLGGVVGFLLSRRTDPTIHALQDANDRIMELENTLTLIGFSEDSDDPEGWVYDADAADDTDDALSGDTGGDEEEDLWTDEGLLSGMLVDDGDPVVVAEFDGGVLLSNEVIPEYNDQLTTQVFAGYNADDISESLLQSVLSYLVSDKLIAAKAQELGLTELTGEDLAEIDREAAEIYADQLEEYAAYFSANTDGSEEAEEGAEPEDPQAAAAKFLEEETGVTPDTIAAELKQSWWAQKYFDYVVRDVDITDEEVRTYYDEQLADQKTFFAEYPEEFEYAHITGDAVLYRPEGYRAVRDILISFSGADDAAAAAGLMDKLELGQGDEETQAQLDALYAPLEAAAQEALDRLNAGQSFESLMDEYGCSADLANEPLRSEGYYISDNSYVNSQEFVEGSLLLDRPGQVSLPLRSANGVHLVQYIGDVPAGEVPLAEAETAVRAEALELKQLEYYEAQREAMLEQANVKYYPDRLH